MNEDKAAPPAHVRRATWYTLSGLVFIITGLTSYLQISIPSVGAILLVIAGVAVILLGLLKYHPTPDALAIFLISLLVFAIVSSGSFAFSSTAKTYSYTRTNYPSASKLALSVSESVGSLDVSFIDDPSLIVNLTYSRSGFPFFGSIEAPLVSPTIVNRLLTVTGSAGFSSLTVLIGSIQVTSLNVSTSTGSLSLRVPDTAKVTSLDAETSTGSISILLATRTLTTLHASASTGSVSIDAQYRTLPANATIVASASTGSVDLTLNTATAIGVDLTATSNTGSVSHATLSGYASPLSETRNMLHVRTVSYSSAIDFLQATLSSSLGSIDVAASSGTVA